MMNRKSIVTGTAATAAALVICLTGCSKEEPEAVVAPVRVVREPPPPPPPAITPVSELMAQLNIDERVEMAEDGAPDNDDDRKAVLEFFDAFARGDGDTLRPMMALADQLELGQMVEAGTWDDSVDGISRVEITTGSGPFGQNCALAIFEVGHEYQPQLWYYNGSGDGYEFEAVLTPPHMIDRLSGSDWIAAWHEILEEELALANEPDAIIALQQNLDEDAEGETGGTKAPPGALGRPSGPITPTTPAPGGPLNPTGR